MLNKARIIVLNTIKYGDSGLIVQSYSNISGMLALYLKGTGKNTKYRNYLHRLSIIDTELISKGDNLPLIKEMGYVKNLSSIRTNIHKNAIAIFICELILKSIKEVEPNAALYDFFIRSIEALEASEKGTANFPAYFLVHLCNISGFHPRDNFFDNGYLFDTVQASYILAGSRSKDSKDLMSKSQSELLHNLLNCSFDELQNIKSNGELRYLFSKKMIDYLSHHLGVSIELKSIEVLHEISCDTIR